MKKIFISFVLVAMLLALCVSAEAQQPKKVPRIGYLSALDPARESARAEAIRLALRERGYIEGQNIVIEYRYGEEKRDRQPELAADLVRLKVDIIVVSGGGGWVQAVKNATKTIPIVMMGVGPDPVKAGLIDSLARPGGNVTGVTNLNPELGGKRLELLKEAVPKLARVAVLYDPAVTSSVLEVKENLQVAARALKLTIQPWEVRDADGFERVFPALNKQRPDGLYGHPSGPLMFANGKRIADLALKSRLPSMHGRREAVDCRWAHVLWGGHRGQLPTRRVLRGQNSEGSQALRLARGAANEVRAGDQSEDGEANRSNDPAVLAVPCGYCDQIKRGSSGE
jgi:putative ABC transport system substrate-binding protein